VDMKFHQWIAGERGRQKLVAEHFDITKSAVSQWVQNGVPVDRMLAVRTLSGGAVTLEELMDPSAPPEEATPELAQDFDE